MRPEPYQYVFDSSRVTARLELADYARESFPADRPLLEGVMDLTHRIFHDFRFDTKATEVSTPVETFFEKRRGVCQDFAHLQIACTRSLGLPARYISGYLRTLPPPGRPRLIGADASHAWCAIWSPGAGWVDFDPTNDCVPSDGHITLAWGRDYSDDQPDSRRFCSGAPGAPWMWAWTSCPSSKKRSARTLRAALTLFRRTGDQIVSTRQFG